uniref:Uncharacterized protein n=1 Tax=Nicotiana tabacum TaxID=4097 RepID=A0A1S3XAZ0_TOBAC|nr:PREDICTED: uncharacterized protein LOC107763034 [Nicotiana tabacum]
MAMSFHVRRRAMPCVHPCPASCIISWQCPSTSDAVPCPASIHVLRPASYHGNVLPRPTPCHALRPSMSCVLHHIMAMSFHVRRRAMPCVHPCPASCIISWQCPSTSDAVPCPASIHVLRPASYHGNVLPRPTPCHALRPSMSCVLHHIMAMSFHVRRRAMPCVHPCPASCIISWQCPSTSDAVPCPASIHVLRPAIPCVLPWPCPATFDAMPWPRLAMSCVLPCPATSDAVP